MYTSLQTKTYGASALRVLFLHAAEDAIVILVAAATGDSVIFLVVCDAFFALFHHLISIHMELVASVALGLARVVTWSQSATREGTLAQVLGGNMRDWWRILRKGDWDTSRRTRAPEATGEELDGSRQPIVLLVAAETRGQRPHLVAVITIVAECRRAGNASGIWTCRWC